MKKGDLLPSEEDVLRALTSDIWDGNRFGSQTFRGEGISLSRLAMYTVREHWRIFRRPGGVEKPPSRRLLKIGQINVGHIEKMGAEHDPPATLTVINDPLDWNDAHAIIPEKISRGLANKLRDALIIHDESSR